jgi:hypothetical protein
MGWQERDKALNAQVKKLRPWVGSRLKTFSCCFEQKSIGTQIISKSCGAITAGRVTPIPFQSRNFFPRYVFLRVLQSSMLQKNCPTLFLVGSAFDAISKLADIDGVKLKWDIRHSCPQILTKVSVDNETIESRLVWLPAKIFDFLWEKSGSFVSSKYQDENSFLFLSKYYFTH